MSRSHAIVISRRLRSCLEPQGAARSGGLVYVQELEVGIRRIRRGKGFSYSNGSGKPIRDGEILARIRSLSIPPAWTSVWICPHDRGHIQAVGFDQRGRKQYLYHQRWREIRDATKFDRVIQFAEALTTIRRRIAQALSARGLPRDKVVATVIRLLDVAHIRIGNEEYAHANGSYGLTTLQDRHAQFEGARLKLKFRGKSGVEREIELHDARLARIVKSCSDLPGQTLFQYVDEGGRRRRATSTDVNKVLKAWTGADFSAKDFRTWAGTVEFVRVAQEDGGRRRLSELVKQVAQCLGNTSTVCRKYYIHPLLLESRQTGELNDWIAAATEEKLKPGSKERRLNSLERITLRILKRHTSRTR
jgi:DNA topoisomerase-1